MPTAEQAERFTLPAEWSSVPTSEFPSLMRLWAKLYQTSDDAGNTTTTVSNAAVRAVLVEVIRRQLRRDGQSTSLRRRALACSRVFGCANPLRFAETTHDRVTRGYEVFMLYPAAAAVSGGHVTVSKAILRGVTEVAACHEVHVNNMVRAAKAMLDAQPTPAELPADGPFVHMMKRMGMMDVFSAQYTAVAAKAVTVALKLDTRAGREAVFRVGARRFVGAVMAEARRAKALAEVHAKASTWSAPEGRATLVKFFQRHYNVSVLGAAAFTDALLDVRAPGALDVIIRGV